MSESIRNCANHGGPGDCDSSPVHHQVSEATAQEVKQLNQDDFVTKEELIKQNPEMEIADVKPDLFREFMPNLMNQIQKQGLQFVCFMPPPAKWNPAHTLTICFDPTAEPYRGLIDDRPELRGYARTDAESLARAFHEAYEDQAPSHGYETREASRKPWADVPEQNKSLMLATADRVLQQFPALQRGAVWDLPAVKPIEGMTLQSFEPNPDPSLARIASALDGLLKLQYVRSLPISSSDLTVEIERKQIMEALREQVGALDSAYSPAVLEPTTPDETMVVGDDDELDIVENRSLKQQIADGDAPNYAYLYHGGNGRFA